MISAGDGFLCATTDPREARSRQRQFIAPGPLMLAGLLGQPLLALRHVAHGSVIPRGLEPRTFQLLDGRLE